MKRSIVAALCALAFCAVLVPAASLARAHPTPTPAPTPTPVADPAVELLVRQQFVAWQAGNINKSLYAPSIVSKLDDAKINDVSRRLGQLGFLTKTVYMGPFLAPDIPPTSHGYLFKMICSEGSVYQWIILDPQGKIASIFFKDRLDTETIVASPSPGPT